MVSFQIDQLSTFASSLHAGVTLYIPPARKAAIADDELLQLLQSPEHLDTIIE